MATQGRGVKLTDSEARRLGGLLTDRPIWAVRQGGIKLEALYPLNVNELQIVLFFTCQET